MSKDALPLFTVIIPCKNRAEYLRFTLHTCMLQKYNPLEVIVSDDGSSDDTRKVTEEASRCDPRIRYVTPGKEVGMRDNFEFALQQVKPGFVIALGGDDGLLPDGIQGMHEVLRDTGMDLLAWPAPLFFYPGVRGAKGQLAIYHRRRSKIIDSRHYLCRQAKVLHYLNDLESPMLYIKGVAATKLIDRVRSRSGDGRFYSCPTPDGYSGIVLAGEVPQYAFSGKPFSIYGLSPKSQGLAYMLNDENAIKDSEYFFQYNSLKTMHPELALQPYSPLITLMTADYLLTARDLPGWPGRFPSIDFRSVLTNGIRELAHGLYGDERISRELRILDHIAAMHGLESFFHKKVTRSKRNRAKKPFEGSGIHPSVIFLDGDSYHIHNIFEAAYAAQYIYQLFSDLKLPAVSKIIARSLRYFFHTIGQGNSFPSESEWRCNASTDRQR